MTAGSTDLVMSGMPPNLVRNPLKPSSRTGPTTISFGNSLDRSICDNSHQVEGDIVRASRITRGAFSIILTSFVRQPSDIHRLPSGPRLWSAHSPNLSGSRAAPTRRRGNRNNREAHKSVVFQTDGPNTKNETGPVAPSIAMAARGISSGTSCGGIMSRGAAIGKEISAKSPDKKIGPCMLPSATQHSARNLFQLIPPTSCHRDHQLRNTTPAVSQKTIVIQRMTTLMFERLTAISVALIFHELSAL